MLDKNINVIRIKAIGTVLSEQGLSNNANNVLGNALKDKISKLYAMGHKTTANALLKRYSYMYGNITSHSQRKVRAYENISGTDISFEGINAFTY